jgi:hypothetical protein
MVTADVVARCPFSIAQDYTADFLEHAEDGGEHAEIRIPLHLFGMTLHRRVGLTFSIHSDDSEPGRSHDQLRVWWTSGTALLPDFHGDIKFRIDGGATRILIEGQYTAPLGVLGRLFDSVIGKRVAATSAKDLASRIATYLELRQKEWLARVR